LKEHPILFKAEMVRAILSGQKTQTRRTNLKTKYAVGDRMWVKETWTDRDDVGDQIEVIFRADGEEYEDGNGFGYEPKWKPSLFMSRKQSRITLEVTAVREERLQDISEADCIAEGVSGIPYMLPGDKAPFMMDSMAQCRYRALCESINGPRSWDENPVVKVISFKRVTA